MEIKENQLDSLKDRTRLNAYFHWDRYKDDELECWLEGEKFTILHFYYKELSIAFWTLVDEIRIQKSINYIGDLCCNEMAPIYHTDYIISWKIISKQIKESWKVKFPNHQDLF